MSYVNVPENTYTVSAGDNKLIKVDITQENILKYNFDTISISPSDYKEFIIDDPWYLDTSQAPDFQSIIDVEKNTIKEFIVPEDTYSVNNYNLQVRLGGTSTVTTKTINISNKSHLNLLKDYYNSIKSSAGNYIWTSSQLYSLKYYYLFHGYSVSNDSFASRWNGTPTRNNSILIPIMFNDDTVLRQGTFQEIPIVTNISITFDENNFSYNLPEHKIYGGNNSGLSGEFTVPAGTYTPLQYHECIMQVLPSDNTWRPTFTINTMYQYPFTKISMKSAPSAYYNGGSGINEHDTFNDLYGKLHLVYPCTSNYKIGHPCNGPATNRCLSCTSGIWNVDDFVNYVNTTDEEKSFGCKSTTHEIFVTADIPFIINPVCSITKLGEADITPEGSTDYTFGTQKRIFYHPMYKQIDCTVTYNGTTHTISGRYTPAELLREIKTLTNANIKVYNNNDEYNIKFPSNLTISDNPFFTSTENLSGLSRMDFTISNFTLTGNFTYEDLFVNSTAGKYTASISPVTSVDIVNYSCDNLPNGLSIDNTSGLISGDIIYNKDTQKYIDTTLIIKGTTTSGQIITKSFRLYINFLYIQYKTKYKSYVHHGQITNLEASWIKGYITKSYVSVSSGPDIEEMNTVLNNAFDTQTCLYNTEIPDTISSGTYKVFTRIEDDEDLYSSDFCYIYVYNRPTLTYNNEYEYKHGDTVNIVPTITDINTVTYTCDSPLPDGLTFDESTGNITGTILSTDIESYNITVTLKDVIGSGSFSNSIEISDTFTISINVPDCDFSYNDFTYNCTDTSYTFSANTLIPVNPVNIISYSLAEGITLPPGLELNTSTGEITGTVNYTSLHDKYINTTITIKGFTTNTDFSIERSFNLYLNFLNIKYNPSKAYIYHQSNATTNIKIEILRGHYSNAWFKVITYPNYDAMINMTDVLNNSFNSETCEFNTTIPSSTIHDGHYYVDVYISDTDKNGNVYTVSAQSIIYVYNTPELNYDDIYYCNLGEEVELLCNTKWTNSKSFKLNDNSDELPSGLELNSSTGWITGTVSVNETIKTYNISVTLTDTVGTASYSVSDSFTISIIHIGYSQSEYTFNVNDSVSIIPVSGDYTYSLTGNLPCGLTFGSDGSITGVCDHPVITVLLITISASDFTKTFELTLNILPKYKCKENDYCKYYVDNELSNCEAIQDKGIYKDGIYHYLLEDNEDVGTVGPYLYILPANHVIDLNIQTITDNNYETNNNNVNCYIKGFPNNEYNWYFISLEDVKQGTYQSAIQIRNKLTDEIIEDSDVFDLSNLDFTDIINYFNEISNKQLSITSDEYCIYLHGVDFTHRQPTYFDDVETQYFTDTVLTLEYHMNDTKILLYLVNELYCQLFYNNKIYFTAYPVSNINFDIPLTNIDNTHVICTYENTASHPIALYMDVVSPLAEQNSADLKTMYQVSKFVYEISKLNYDLTEFTIPFGCYFTTTPGTEIAGPYVLEGVLPDGLIFDSATGNISGTCNESINSSVNIIASDNTSDQLTFNTVDIQNYNNVYKILNNKTTIINPITPINNYLGGSVTYENVLPNGCTFDTSTGTLTINTSNKYEYIFVNCIQTLTNTELKINNNILIKVLHYVQIQDNIVNYS